MKGNFRDYNWSKVPRRCPVCGGNAIRSLLEWKFRTTNVNRLLLGRCHACSMVFAVNSDEMDMSNHKYVDWQPDTDDDVITSKKINYNKRILALLADYIKPGGHILDYGAGYCIFLRVARNAGYEVQGVNPCRYMANWAANRLNILVYPVFGWELETDQRFDLILSDQTFEHLVDPLKDLRKIYSLLVVGGLAYINVPNWWTFRRFLHGKKCLKDFSHYNYFTPRTLANLCRIEKLGFEILKVSPTRPDKVLPKIGHWIFNRIGIGDCSILIRKMPQGQQSV